MTTRFSPGDVLVATDRSVVVLDVTGECLDDMRRLWFETNARPVNIEPGDTLIVLDVQAVHQTIYYAFVTQTGRTVLDVYGLTYDVGQIFRRVE